MKTAPEMLQTTELLERMEALTGEPFTRATLENYIRHAGVDRANRRGPGALYPRRSLGQAAVVWRLRKLKAQGVRVTPLSIGEVLRFIEWSLMIHPDVAQSWAAMGMGPDGRIIRMWGGSPDRAQMLVTGTASYFKAIAGIDLMRPVLVIPHWIIDSKDSKDERPREQYHLDVVTLCGAEDDELHAGMMREAGEPRFVGLSNPPEVLAEVPYP